MLLKTLSRRDILVGAGKLAVGTAGIASLLSGGLDLLSAEAKEKPTKAEVKERPKYSWPWPYKKLDPAVVGEIAYNKWFDVFCCQGVVHGLFDPLGEMIGEPYTSFPIEALRFGMGGTLGWGAMCGTLIGGGLQIGLVVPDKDLAGRMIIDLVSWYGDTVLPTYKPKTINPKGADFKNLTKSDSPLCHISVGRWMSKEGAHFDDPRRKDRCARVTASVAVKTVEILNGYIDSGEYKPVYEIQNRIRKMPLRKDVKIPSQNNCSDCHNPFKVAFKAVKNRTWAGAPGGEYKE